ncbi:hypothetical protein BDA99DRAFT_588940 [Phascolomyces articulosus]|uniref:Galactose oxidase n=1 Tax=Phascolomyces articulosus TaxID=60185 RepID=A0AAD5K9Z7_9FUNG|nr:hypothetical protein BDA99DRAFT_588940 [Phascolomyces articulosus]
MRLVSAGGRFTFLICLGDYHCGDVDGMAKNTQKRLLFVRKSGIRLNISLVVFIIMVEILGQRSIFALSMMLIMSQQFILLVYSLTPQPRSDHKCVYMSTVAKIFCYGGEWFGPTDDGYTRPTMDLIFFSLDLSQRRTITEIQDAWENIDANVGPNTYFAMVAVPTHNLIFMDGGAGARDPDYGTPHVRYKSATYNTETGGTWSQVTPERLGTAVNMHTATLGPDNDTIFIWGGERDEDTGLTPGEAPNPREMFIFDINNKETPWKTGNVAETTYYTHTGVLVGSLIYYIGGSYISTSEGGREFVPMNIVRTFDTNTEQWGSLPITGDVIPTKRDGHTATLKPSTGEIILFGGYDADDYFYILNTHGDLSWSNRTIQVTANDSFTPRQLAAHSTTLAGSYLFIMFGITSNDGITINSTNRVWVMDVNQWAWISEFDGIQPQPIPTETPVEPNTLSGGAIAGIVVGAVLGLAIIAGVIFFLLKRKKRQLQEKREKDQIILTTTEHHDLSPPPPTGFSREYSDNDNNVSQSMLHQNNAPDYSQDNSSRGGGDAPNKHSMDFSDKNTRTSWPNRFSYNIPDESQQERPTSTAMSYENSSDSNTAVGYAPRLVMLPVKPDAFNSS